MKEVLALLEMYAERYLCCSDMQAEFDVRPENRDEMCNRFFAILEYVRMKVEE